MYLLRRKSTLLACLLSPAWVLSAPPAQAGQGSSAPAKASVDFKRDVAPIFQKSCSPCHGSSASMGRLQLDTTAQVLKGGASGPVVIPGKSGDSLLVKRILGLTDAPRMPMNGPPLDESQVKVIRAWIDEGKLSAEQAEAVSTPAASSPAVAVKDSSVFAEKIRPLFAARCYQCHGPSNAQNGLRLDSLAGILKGSESGKIVVPGNGEHSRLVRRLMAQERPQMPYGGPPLSPDQVKLIRQWIDDGAPGPDSNAALPPAKIQKHWAYVKPVQPVPPAVQEQGWARNPIDQFILAKLEQQGLKHAPEADKDTLIRRVSLDLIGLPPTPQEVDAFVADKDPQAYEHLVDRLLASRHYGERWARPWLDLARYADTNGYEKDARRTAWAYRDWVIRALNDNLSFKQFTIDQIAGDMLPHPAKDQLIASGFNRNTMLNREGGVDPEEYYWYELVDRANTTASVWLGSTLACAQCHNHKFDPFTQKDYYRFLAFFGNSDYKVIGDPLERYAFEPELELPTPEQDKKSKEFRAEIARLQQILDTPTPQLQAAQVTWEAAMLKAPQGWSVIRPTKYESKGGAKLSLLADGSILAGGPNPRTDSYTLEGKSDLASITAVRLEVLPDASLPHGGPGRDPEGNFFLSNFEVDAAPLANPQAVQHVTFKIAEANESQESYSVKNLIVKGEGVRGWAIDINASKTPLPRQAVLVPEKPFGFAGGTLLTVRLKHEMRHSSRNIGHFRVSLTNIAKPTGIVQLPANLWPVLEKPAAHRTAQESQDLAAAYRRVAPLLDTTRAEMAKAEESLNKLGIVTAMIMRDKDASRPSTYLRERGSFSSKGDLLYADVPSALNPLPDAQKANRLALAEWLVSEDNPLTARVTVNHFWETIFGRGIVQTSEDFGTQGDAPTHPELLDWLATEFMQEGWDMKKIQRLMVTSATYRQSSKATPEVISRDPYNQLYAHGPRFRVEAETVHDLALSAGGLLSSKMYGPPAMPYQPDGIWDMPYSNDKWVMSDGEDRYRRAVYTFMRRSAPYPSLATFDAPSRELCTVRRVRTNTPLQALTTLNDPFFLDAARAMAKRMMTEGGSDDDSRIIYGFRIATSRRPDASEIERIRAAYHQQLDLYRGHELEAYQLVAMKRGTVADAPALAAWTVVANVLLNMDETISKE